MGLGAAAIKLHLELRERGLLDDVRSVVELGSQELHLPRERFVRLLGSAGIDVTGDSRFADLANWPGLPRVPARHLYELLGATEYRSIDLNGVYGSIPQDMNAPLEDRSLWGAFDLVTDHGAAEHAFDIAEAYRTVHRLCRPGGLIVASQMVFGTNGYYSLDPSFYEGLAAANGYHILFSSYVVDCGEFEQHHVPLADELLRAFDWNRLESLGVCYVLQRQTDADFVMPYQGSFLSASQHHLGFQLQFLPAPPARTYLPMPRSAVEALPARELASSLVHRIGARLRRR